MAAEDAEMLIQPTLATVSTTTIQNLHFKSDVLPLLPFTCIPMCTVFTFHHWQYLVVMWLVNLYETFRKQLQYVIPMQASLCHMRLWSLLTCHVSWSSLPVSILWSKISLLQFSRNMFIEEFLGGSLVQIFSLYDWHILLSGFLTFLHRIIFGPWFSALMSWSIKHNLLGCNLVLVKHIVLCSSKLFKCQQ